MNNLRTFPLQNQHVYVNNQTGSPRWWRFRRSRVSGTPSLPHQENQQSWIFTAERICSQMSVYLPHITASTGKAIIGVIILVVAWKFIIWTAEIIITGVCLAVAVMILLWFFRPDAALWVITQVLLPYSEVFRTNVNYSFFQLSNSSNHTPQLTPALPPIPQPRQRSPRTTINRIYPEAPVLEANA